MVEFTGGNPELFNLIYSQVVLLALEFDISAGLSAVQFGVSFVTNWFWSFACIGVIMTQYA